MLLSRILIGEFLSRSLMGYEILFSKLQLSCRKFNLRYQISLQYKRLLRTLDKEQKKGRTGRGREIEKIKCVFYIFHTATGLRFFA